MVDKEYQAEYYKKNKKKMNENNNTNHWLNRDWHNLMNLANRVDKEGREKWLELQKRYNEKNPSICISYGEPGARKHIQVRKNSKKLKKYLSLVKKKDWDAIELLRLS